MGIHQSLYLLSLPSLQKYNPMQNHPSWSPLRITGSFILIILLSVLFIGGIGVTIAAASYDNLNDPGALRWQQVTSSIGLFLAPPLLLMYWSKLPPGEFLGLRAAHLKLQHSLFFLLVIIGSFLTIDALAYLNKAVLPDAPWVEALIIQEAETKTVINTLLSDMVPLTLLANAVVMVIVPAVGEELFFRGVIQGLLNQKVNHHFSIAITAILFAAVHWQPLSILPIIFMGVVFGYVRHWTKSIWIPIALHFINNGVALLGAYMNEGTLLEESTLAGSMWSYIGPLLVFTGLYGVYINRK